MKKAILYLFLFTYSTVMLRPVTPYVRDFVAHLLFFEDHMLTVHSHHGKFHVHAEVTETAKDDLPEKSTNNIKKDHQGHEHIYIEPYDFPNPQISINFPASFSIHANHAFIDHDFPPPRV